jgi:hypothetical protein
MKINILQIGIKIDQQWMPGEEGMDIGIMSWFGLIDGWLSRVAERHSYIDDAGRGIDLSRL